MKALEQKGIISLRQMRQMVSRFSIPKEEILRIFQENSVPAKTFYDQSLKTEDVFKFEKMIQEISPMTELFHSQKNFSLWEESVRDGWLW